jgi:hypothetical protein
MGGVAMARARRRTSATKRSAAPSRARKARSSPAKASTPAVKASAASGGEFVCPECGRTFTRAAALGAHRSRVHGVAGQSAQAKRTRSRRQQTSGPGSRRVPTPFTAGAPTKAPSASQNASRSRRASTVARRDGVDRDALLKALFPAGMPPREEVIRAASSWLEEGERIARLG